MTTYQLSQFPWDTSAHPIGTTPAGQTILLGGFSGLFFEKKVGNLYQFVTVPDRGPNGTPTDTDGDGVEERPFALPDYQARVIRFTLNPDSQEIKIVAEIPLKRADGITPISGRPNLQAGKLGFAYTDEIPIDLLGKPLNNDPLGADLEAIVIAPDGSFWMSDEYRPAIYHFSATGVLLNRFIPQGTAIAAGLPPETFGQETLPAVYAQRRANRGFEGLALDTDKNRLYAWIQSPIDNPDTANDSSSRQSSILRILEVNPSNGEATGEYIQILNDLDKAVDKIGDAVYQGKGKFLVNERDSAVGPQADKLVFEVDLNKATNILGTELSRATGEQALEKKTAADLAALGVKPVEKTFLFNLASLGYVAGDKTEGLALLPDGTIAVINDNDFGLLEQPLPTPPNGSIPLNPEPVPIVLGLVKPQIRVATFNASLNRNAYGELIADLSTPNDTQAQATAEIIQRINPDVILINEFDYDATGLAARLFQENYLGVSQNGVTPIEFPYVYWAPSNTGIASGFDLDNNGKIVNIPGQSGFGNDAFGFGNFPGQFGMVLYSKFAINLPEVKTFQFFRWRDMPGALLPVDPSTGQPWYSEAELNAFRLSSKSHWDIPIQVGNEVIHILADHPTPPVFDGPEDRNGTRNHDEIRLWADYISPGRNSYIYDDGGSFGGFTGGERFVILGDHNADPVDGDSVNGAILQLLSNPLVNTELTPASEGGVEAAKIQGGANANHKGNPRYDTSDFGDAPPSSGNLRVDYALPSKNLNIVNAEVFWPTSQDPLAPLVAASDHRLTFVDIQIGELDTLPNGVASGDVTQDTALLWTLSTVVGDITFEYATNPNFQNSQKVTAQATDITLPVKVELEELEPNTNYYYRVVDAFGTSKSGEFITAAESGKKVGLNFGVTGDWRGELAPYPAISNVAAQNLDFFVKHGDTIYADYASPAVPIPQAQSLRDYRAKHQEVYGSRFGENFWAELQASTAIFATIDDHEVINDFAGGAPASSDPRFPETTGLINDTQLYNNGLQAFQEYNALRDEFYGATGDPRTAEERKLYRYNTYGDDAAVMVLDNRSFRDQRLVNPDLTNPADVARFYTESLTQERTMLGKAQLEDLKADLLAAENAGITWKFVMVPEPIQNIGPLAPGDRFEGYGKERTEILRFIKENDIDNVVFIAADVHVTLVNNLTYQEAWGTPQIATGAWEITTGSVAFHPPTVAPKAQLNALLNSVGFDPIGLNDNLPQAEGLINAQLLKGDYIVDNTYGWTAFEIDPTSQQLTVTTYGIPSYSESELLADPQAIASRTPEVKSQFVVTPQPLIDTPPTDIFGTSADDEFDSVLGTKGFIGSGQNLFTASGNDTVDVTQASGNNRIDLGSGDDTLFAGSNNRIIAGSGRDRLFLGRPVGNNIVTGGGDADQFWLVTDMVDIPTKPNIITDFTLGSDVLGFGGTNLGFADILLTQDGPNTRVNALGQDLAILQNVLATSLSAANFVFN
jgi:phosphodiesterase/alkaline phosphatase D-like protein